MNSKHFYKILADQGIRVFVFSLGIEKISFIHPNKTVLEWRSDVRKFISYLNNVQSKNGHADDIIYNTVMSKFINAGYFEVNDIASDVFEGRIAKYTAGIEDDPEHGDQLDGFGHYGWESKTKI